MERDAERVLVHTLGDGSVDLDDTELGSSDILVGVREGRLSLGAAVEDCQYRTMERVQRWTHMSSFVTGCRTVLSILATSMSAVMRMLPTLARIP